MSESVKVDVVNSGVSQFFGHVSSLIDEVTFHRLSCGSPEYNLMFLR